MVPAPHVFQKDWFLRLIFTGGGGSCAPRRRLLRSIFARDSGSCASCLPERLVPALNFYGGLWFLRPTASVPALNFCRGWWFLRLMSSRQMSSCAQFLRGAVVPAPHSVGSCAQFLQGILVPAPDVFQTDGFLRPIRTKDDGPCAPRRSCHAAGRAIHAPTTTDPSPNWSEFPLANYSPNWPVR